MNSRIKKLKQRIDVDKYPICVEKARLIMDAFNQTEGEPQIIRRAKALARVLEKIPIFIEDDELIVGNCASRPMSVEFDFDYGTWSPDEVATLKKEGYTVTQEDDAYLKVLNEYWKYGTLVSREGAIFDEEKLWPFMQSGITLPPWKTRQEGGGGGYAQGGMGLGPGFYLCGFDFAKVINGGLNKIVEEAEEELRKVNFMDVDSIKKAYFLKSVIIAHKAIIHFANRFADLAAAMSVEEYNPLRKNELRRIAETCRRVPANPARTFYEALQSFWFIFLMTTPQTTAAAGRFDQYMYPFYRRDIEQARLTREEALELLECLRLKDMQWNRTSGKTNRQKNAGMAKWHNWTIGGQTANGEDATNELTYLILEAAKDCPTPHHTITLRVHEGTPEALMLKALEVVRTGIGMPAFVSDKSYIEFLLSQGLPLETARDYIISGCLDATIVGQSRIATYGMFIVPLVFDIFMHNGMDPNTHLQIVPKTRDLEDYKTFSELMDAFKEQLSYFMSLFAAKNNIELQVVNELFPDPVRSSLMVNALKEGKDMMDRRMPFENAAVMNPVGMINVADSLAAIKKLIYDEKKFEMKHLKAALAANWQGNGYDEMRKMFLAAPKYGNDDDYVDSIASELYLFWSGETATFSTIFGGKHIPTAISVSAQWPGGALTGATPDGRYAGECLADGTMSAMRGMDTRGPTALIKSALKIDQSPYEATLMNMKFHPSALKTIEDLKKLSDLIKTYFEFGGKHIQFNVVNKEMLLDAQQFPEKHRDLIVRVAGYSAYFASLSKTVQDEIINRTEYSKLG